MPATRILVTGALGQIGRVLVADLAARHGTEAVVATDLAAEAPSLPARYLRLDATSEGEWARVATLGPFAEVYHLVAVLSARGEGDPWGAWDINMRAWRLALEHAAGWPGCRVFFPSSIAVYGPPLPGRVDEDQALRPLTSYGISKSAGEQWGAYLAQARGLDVRSLRLPGVIGHQTLPGGGTTDYAVEIFHAAVRGERYRCFLGPDTRLPMVYMDDLVAGVRAFMAADRASLRGGAIYNLGGFSVTPAELAGAIARRCDGFAIEYAPDRRQAIADSWPAELDDRRARADWGWAPAFGADDTAEAMLAALRHRPAALTTP